MNRKMDRQEKTALGCALSPLFIWLYFGICWVVNLAMLLRCDFEGPSWRDEIIHAIGLIGPAAGVTVWF